MTTTISAQTGTTTAPDVEIQIVRTPPTYQDAQLILQQQQVDAVTGASRGYDHLRAFETPPTPAQARKRYPRDSAEWQQITAFLGSAETTSTFVRQGILNEGLVLDLYAVAEAWTLSEKLIKGLRREFGEPRFLENFEWLARRAT